MRKLSLLFIFSTCLIACNNDNDTAYPEIKLDKSEIKADAIALDTIVVNDNSGKDAGPWAVGQVETIIANKKQQIKNDLYMKDFDNAKVYVLKDTVVGEWYTIITNANNRPIQKPVMKIKLSENNSGIERNLQITLVSGPRKPASVTIKQEAK